MPKAFVPAITGAQSVAIAGALRDADWKVDGSSRSRDDDPHERAAGADLLILTVPQDHRPGAMVDFVDGWVEAARRGEIGRVILNLGGTPGPAEEHPFFADLQAMEDRVVDSGLPHVVLRPTVYLDNLAAPWAAEAIAGGTITYPAAADAEISWISHRTLGLWVVAVADGSADGRILPVGGPEALTGAALAERVGATLGRDITYVPLPPAAFAAGMNEAMGAPAGDRLGAIYERLERHPDYMRVDPIEAERFGVELEGVGAFAKRVLAS